LQSNLTAIFQLIYPLWDATLCRISSDPKQISTHTSLMGCNDNASNQKSSSSCISTHTPLVGCNVDSIESRYFRLAISTHTSLTGCDGKYYPIGIACSISTHAPLWDAT